MGNINLTFSEGRHHLFYLDNYLKDTVNEETIIFILRELFDSTIDNSQSIVLGNYFD